MVVLASEPATRVRRLFALQTAIGDFSLAVPHGGSIHPKQGEGECWMKRKRYLAEQITLGYCPRSSIHQIKYVASDLQTLPLRSRWYKVS